MTPTSAVSRAVAEACTLVAELGIAILEVQGATTREEIADALLPRYEAVVRAAEATDDDVLLRQARRARSGMEDALVSDGPASDAAIQEADKAFDLIGLWCRVHAPEVTLPTQPGR